MESKILKVNDLGKQFGGIKAVNGLSFVVREGHIHGLIGPNGAGKTTTFNLISGFYKPSQGSVRLFDEEISGLGMYKVARKGVIRTFQHSTLFAEMSVLENVLVGTHMMFKPNFLAALIGNERAIRNQAIKRSREVLEFFGLEPFTSNLAGELSHGHQRTLGMAVAMASNPKILLLDEPFTGMNPEETQSMMGLMAKLRDSGMTLLLVEHDMTAIMGLCDRITVMNFGKLLTEGKPLEIRNHPDVIEAYLGTRNHAT